jgi:single-stranded-DNA-specific exonuclease
MPKIVERRYAKDDAERLVNAGVHPVLARVFAARGITAPDQLDNKLSQLLPFTEMRNAVAAATLLADAIAAKRKLMIIADYDCDGATACAVGVRGLRAFGARIDYLVPNRFEYGYGLTPEIVRLAHAREPDILITVDNGMASIDGVNEAKRLGMQVLITDHHLAGDVLPDADCIVNPNHPDCGFPSKSIAGVGVMFYVLMALRAELRARGHFNGGAEPNLASLLDIVALGTVADVVKLDNNNRRLVEQGVRRIRAGQAAAGIRALYRVAGREPRKASTYDLGFVLGPRLNAAGRLEDMSLGIECLITDDDQQAMQLARQLDALNRERRELQADMQESALAGLERFEISDRVSLCVFDPEWHQGIVGLLAGRLKDKFHRPAIAFARGNNGELKGSGRAIAGLHLRDALDLISKKSPTLIVKFGGHAGAAGLSIREESFIDFAAQFEATVTELLSPADLEQVIETDGELSAEEIKLALASLLASQVWGQGFPAPLFQGVFTVASQRIVAEKHLKLKLIQDNHEFEAIYFSHTEPVSKKVLCIYRLAINEYLGLEDVQLTLEHCRDAQL